MLSYARERLAEISSTNIWRFVLVYVGVMLSIRVFSPVGYLLAMMALLLAMRGQATVSFYSLLIVPCLNIMNPLLFHSDANYVFASKILMLLLAGILIQQASAIRERYNVLRPFSWLIGYIALMLALAPFSLVPIVSALKAALFLSTIGALIAMVSVMLQGQVHPGPVRSAVLAVCCVFILGSLLALPFPRISRSMLYLRDTTTGSDLLNDLYGLYNGVTYHSQTLGPLLALLNAFLLSDYIFNLQRGGKLHQLLLLGIPVLIYLSSSRTALLTYLGSIIVTWLFMGRSQRVAIERKRFVHGLLLAACLLGTVSLLFSTGLRKHAMNFLEKRQKDDSPSSRDGGVFSTIAESRLGLVDSQMESFRRSPVIGNGFQVSENIREQGIHSLSDILSSKVEKGVLPVMILDEGGIIGAMIMIGFVVSAYRTFLKRSCYCFLSTFVAFLLANMGEACMFSPSGPGGVFWTICFCALLLDLHRIRYDQIRSRPMEAMGTQANWTFR
ncbi:MAG: O-antigen ligase family protein [Deltaproteobacteria bacterium]